MSVLIACSGMVSNEFVIKPNVSSKSGASIKDLRQQISEMMAKILKQLVEADLASLRLRAELQEALEEFVCDHTSPLTATKDKTELNQNLALLTKLQATLKEEVQALEAVTKKLKK